MKLKPYYKDDLTTIFNGNSEEIIETLNKVDLVLTDPPYGLNESWSRNYHGSNGKTKLWGDVPEWDKTIISYMDKIIDKGTNAIIWGANNYKCDPAKGWIVWDKMQQKSGSADCELAWMNLDVSSKVFRMSRIDAYKNKAVFPKRHPNEKPIQLGLFCLKLASSIETMLDPFMGVGSFLIAARKLKIRSVGIDMNLDYCKEAVQRITKGIGEGPKNNTNGGFGFYK